MNTPAIPVQIAQPAFDDLHRLRLADHTDEIMFGLLRAFREPEQYSVKPSHVLQELARRERTAAAVLTALRAKLRRIFRRGRGGMNLQTYLIPIDERGTMVVFGDRGDEGLIVLKIDLYRNAGDRQFSD